MAKKSKSHWEVRGFAVGGLCLPEGFVATACGRILRAGSVARLRIAVTCKTCRRVIDS